MDSKLEQEIAPFDCRFEEFWEDFLNPGNGRISKGIITFGQKLYGENQQRFLSLLASKGNTPIIALLREVITNPMHNDEIFAQLQKLKVDYRCLKYRYENVDAKNRELTAANNALETNAESLQNTNRALKARIKGLRAAFVAIVLLYGANEVYKKYVQSNVSPPVDTTKKEANPNQIRFNP